MEVPIHEPTGQKHTAETLGRSRCAVQRNALVGPVVPQLPLDRFGNLYATVSCTGLRLGVVDLDTDVRDRLAIGGLHIGVARMKRC